MFNVVLLWIHRQAHYPVLTHKGTAHPKCFLYLICLYICNALLFVPMFALFHWKKSWLIYLNIGTPEGVTDS